MDPTFENFAHVLCSVIFVEFLSPLMSFNYFVLFVRLQFSFPVVNAAVFVAKMYKLDPVVNTQLKPDIPFPFCMYSLPRISQVIRPGVFEKLVMLEVSVLFITH